MNNFAAIILAGGKGTRMGSSDRHKVCFEVLGVPVIIRALETYNLCGSMLNVVVVGMMSETVMATVNSRFSGVVYAFQDKPLGTGDAAKKGAEILERMRFQGDVLVVAGDKVIAPSVIRKLLAVHRKSAADAVLATAKRPPGSSTGILLKTNRGNIAGILEEAERQRLIALSMLEKEFRGKALLSGKHVEKIVQTQCSERTARKLLQEIWADTDSGSVVRREGFEARFPEQERRGEIKIGAEVVAATDVLARFDQMNLSTYIFRAEILYDALNKLQSVRPGGEVYLTDIFSTLAQGRKPARVIGCEIPDTRDIMAFNNPQELLAIEAVYRARRENGDSPAVVQGPHEHRTPTATARAWAGALAKRGPEVHRQLRNVYGGEIPFDKIARAVDCFIQRFGAHRPVLIVRSPGRINLMGRHIDHQGGTVNVMAVDREIVLVASPREDDCVQLENADATHFTGQSFRISDLIAKLDWDDWQKLIDGPRIQRLLESARGDWANYVKAAILRLQEKFRDRQLRGLDLMVSGDIPMGAGLSSSSALVVATAEAVRAFNSLPVSAQRLVSLCGEGEWFVGTRGGAADHAAIRLSRRGYVTRVGFFPFELHDSAPFFPEHDLVVCNSGIYAGKSHSARNAFNSRVAAYHIGRVLLKMMRPDLASRISHLRDVRADHLGLGLDQFTSLLGQLPERISRAKVQAGFSQIPEADRQTLERLFTTHDAPASGYQVRGVVLFGLAEMARAARCLDLLKAGDAAGLGRLMTISHDGDRVSRKSRTDRKGLRPGNRRPKPPLDGGRSIPEGNGDLALMPGAYGCSLPEVDAIVDLLIEQPGVEGAQLAGAGLGGCVMALVRKASTPELLSTLGENQIQGQVFHPIAGACSLHLPE